MSMLIGEKTVIYQSILDTKVKIVIPVCRAFHNMNDFSAFDDRCFEFENDFISGSFTVHHFDKYEDDVLNGIFSLQDFVNHSMPYGSAIKHQYLDFTFNLTHVDETKSKETENLSEMDWYSLLRREVLYSFEDEYKMFVFAFFLSFPVTTTFEKGIILCDNKIFSQTDKYSNSFDGDTNIDFQKCWNYLHDSSKFKFGYSQNNASRFVSILSKMNETDDIITQIFYATMALEAVYARGTSEGIARQIIDKVKIFLNIEIEDNKLRQLYDIRSRYIHGDTDIELAFLNFDAVPEKEWDKLYALYFYASEILYKTAKRVIEENISEINFDYTVRLS